MQSKLVDKPVFEKQMGDLLGKKRYAGGQWVQNPFEEVISAVKKSISK